MGRNGLGLEMETADPETDVPLETEGESRPPPERTLALTFEANLLNGLMLLEKALGVPLELPVRLRFAELVDK
jgi:hypothetical protein